MFDTKEIGRKISEFRKVSNMTQMELADRLNISFQAVSNWERGNSMPDISKLPELAELFGISIDELLGKKSELITNIIEGDIEEFLGNTLVAAEELKEAAPILQPAQIERIVAVSYTHLDVYKRQEEVFPWWPEKYGNWQIRSRQLPKIRPLS